VDKIIKKVGDYICNMVPNNPNISRKAILIAYLLYKLKLNLLPDNRLSNSKQYSSKYIADVVAKMLLKPQNSALVSVFTPCELLESFNIVPMCAELYSAYLTGAYAETVFCEIAKHNNIPDTFCSYHKILLGSAYSKVLEKPRLIINTSLVCDANNITFKELSKLYGIPQFYIDVPSCKNKESVEYVAEQFRQLKNFLEKQTKKTLNNKIFLENINRSKQTINILKNCYNAKKLHTLNNNMTSELYEFYITHNALGTKESLRYSKLLLNDIKKAIKTNAKRLLWIHTTPFWQKTVQKMLNFNDDYQIVGCDMNYEGLIDTNIKDPYEFMASRLVYSSWNNGESRLNSIIQAAKDWKVDGVICFCHWGCKQTLGLSSIIKTELEKQGFPTLILNGDGCDRLNSSDEQMSTRLNAFLEVINNK